MTYVHGYSERETQRLYEPARILEDILYTGTGFPAKARVLEAGCGVGAQKADRWPARTLTRRPPSR